MEMPIYRRQEYTICDCCKKHGNCDRQRSTEDLHRQVVELLNDTLGDIEAPSSPFKSMAMTIECSHPEFCQYKEPTKEKQEACLLPLNPII